MAFVPCTVEGHEFYVEDTTVIAFGIQQVQVGADPEDGSAVLEEKTVVSFASGFQVAVDQTPQEFITAAAAAAKAVQDA